MFLFPRLQTLKIMLTSDEDPFFHYVLTLREDSFSQLRSSQGLLVDFAQFPRKFTELVEQCVGEAATSESPRYGSARAVCRADTQVPATYLIMHTCCLKLSRHRLSVHALISALCRDTAVTCGSAVR